MSIVSAHPTAANPFLISAGPHDRPRRPPLRGILLSSLTTVHSIAFDASDRDRSSPSSTSFHAPQPTIHRSIPSPSKQNGAEVKRGGTEGTAPSATGAEGKRGFSTTVPTDAIHNRRPRPTHVTAQVTQGGTFRTGRRDQDAVRNTRKRETQKMEDAGGAVATSAAGPFVHLIPAKLWLPGRLLDKKLRKVG